MGRVAEELSRIRLRCVSRDQRIAMQLTGGSGLALRFTSGGFRQYEELGLAAQLTWLTNELWTRQLREAAAVCHRFGVTVNEDPDTAPDRPHRELLKRQRQLMAHGLSGNECVKVTAVGMREWTVRIRPKSLADMTEEVFTAEYLTAVARTARNHAEQLRVLAKAVFSASPQ